MKPHFGHSGESRNPVSLISYKDPGPRRLPRTRSGVRRGDDFLRVHQQRSFVKVQ